MNGFVLVSLGVILVLLVCICIIRNYNNDDIEGIGFSSILVAIVFLGFLIALPVSRIDSKANIMEIEQLRVVIEHSRTAQLSEFERVKLIETISTYNEVIANWKIKGIHWYNNKWYYAPECKDVKFIE